MTKSYINPLREMLEDVDAQLLKLLTGPRPLDDVALQRVAMLESARNAVQRLLAVAES